MACIKNVLIIGGGNAGLAAAISLSKQGVQCDVVETADGTLGASLGLSGRVTDALVELGIYDEVYETGRPFPKDTTADSLYDAAGRLIRRGPRRAEWPGAKTAVGVYRPQLIKILHDAALRLGASFTRGITADSIVEEGDACLVTMTNGEQRRYDLVIGADGISSRTRAALFPNLGKPEYSGQVSIRWMVDGPQLVAEEGFYIGPLGRIGFYYLPHQKITYVPAVIDEAEYVRKTDEEIFERYTALLESFTAPAIVELRGRLTPESVLIYRPFDWILVDQPWYKGRTLLIGDAAHATTAHMGMGAGMALEDAVVLGQCIGAAATLAEGLDAFMRRRFERVRTVVDTSVALSRLEQIKAPPAENAVLLEKAFAIIGEPY